MIKHHAMKMYGGVEIYIYPFLTSVLDGYEWSYACPSPFLVKKNMKSFMLVIIRGIKFGHVGRL
jgi:hypothetical protein